MKSIIKNTLGLAVIMCLAIFSLSGCYESHYNRQYHHHTRHWYDRHHTPPPPGVNFDIDVRR